MCRITIVARTPLKTHERRTLGAATDRLNSVESGGPLAALPTTSAVSGLGPRRRSPKRPQSGILRVPRACEGRMLRAYRGRFQLGGTALFFVGNQKKAGGSFASRCSIDRPSFRRPTHPTQGICSFLSGIQSIQQLQDPRSVAGPCRPSGPDHQHGVRLGDNLVQRYAADQSSGNESLAVRSHH